VELANLKSSGPSVDTRAVTVRWRTILLIAVIARLAFAVYFFNFSAVPPLEGRGFENVAIALSLRAGHGFSSPYFSDSGPTAFMTPVYPWFLAGVMDLFGTGSAAATVVVIVQEFISLLTLLLVMFSARCLFGNRAANMAGFFCALAPPMLTAPLFSWDTSFSAFLLAATFAAAPTALISRARFIPAGVFCGIAGLLNPALIPAVWSICGWAAWKAGKSPWLGIISFFLVFSPWIGRNAVVMHAFIPFRTDFGYELWIGNHAGGDGGFDESLDPMLSAPERTAFVQKGELTYFTEKGELAKQYIRAHPARFAALNLKRFYRFWTASNEGAEATMIPTFVLAISGLVLMSRRNGPVLLFCLPLILFPLPYYITHPFPRFEYVIEPLVLVLAGYSAAKFFESGRPANRCPTD